MAEFLAGNWIFYLRQGDRSTGNQKDFQIRIEWQIRCHSLCRSLKLWHCICCVWGKRCWWIYSSLMAPINLKSQYRRRLWSSVLAFQVWLHHSIGPSDFDFGHGKKPHIRLNWSLEWFLSLFGGLTETIMYIYLRLNSLKVVQVLDLRD